MSAGLGINEKFASRVADMESAVNAMAAASFAIRERGAESRAAAAEGLRLAPSTSAADAYYDARARVRAIVKEVGLSIATEHQLTPENSARLGLIEAKYDAAAAGVRACGLIG